MSRILNELGYHHVMSSHSKRDVFLLFASRFIRLFAFGSVAPILVLYLRLLGFPDKLVGTFLSLTLLGDVLLSLMVTWTADKYGRRNVLALGALLMGVSGVVFAISDSYLALLAAAVFGVISPSGNEVGPFSAVEVGMLSQLVEPNSRVYVLMWYQVLGFLGTAAGNLVSGYVIDTLENSGHPLVNAYRAVFIIYGAVAIAKILLSLSMTTHSEIDHPPVIIKPSTATDTSNTEREPLLASVETSTETSIPPPPPSQLSLLKLVTLCLLFSLDSFASSLIPISFISYYFRLRFDASIGFITKSFSATATIAGFSQLLAGSIARRIGIISTMVGTHMPAQIFTILLAFVPTIELGLVVLIGRACIGSMDSSVRGAFLSAIIPKESRTRFLGIVNVCKTLASAPGPTLSGILASWGGLRWSFVICGSVKLLYDVGLLIGFKTAKLEH